MFHVISQLASRISLKLSEVLVSSVTMYIEDFIVQFSYFHEY